MADDKTFSCATIYPGIATRDASIGGCNNCSRDPIFAGVILPPIIKKFKAVMVPDGAAYGGNDWPKLST